MKKIFLILCLLYLTSCYNPYLSNYVDVRQQKISYSNANTKSNFHNNIKFLGQNEEPKLYITENMDNTGEALLENGYIMIGSANFNSEEISKRDALNAAKKIGAVIVVIQTKYRGTITESIPFDVKRPDRRAEIWDTVYDDTGIVNQRRKVITVEGEYQTTYHNQTKDFFDYKATFWAKLGHLKLGVFVTDLPSEMRILMGTNRGIIVTTVVKGTPAFDADILNNDIILELNDERISDRRHFFKLLAANRGKSIKLKIFRKNAEIIKEIQLND